MTLLSTEDRGDCDHGSAYMHWARTQQAARFNLAVSGVAPVSREEMGIQPGDLELNGPGHYGWPPLMEALSAHLRVSRDRVCHADGTSMANHLAMAVCLRPGDEVLIEEPAYGLLMDVARYLGAVIRRLPRRRENAFRFDPAEIASALHPGIRLVVVTNLHNPSSARIPDATLVDLAQRAAAVNARLLVDEVYLDATFDPSLRTAHVLGDHVLTTSSLTKVYGLGGLRCGWVVAAPELIQRMWRLHDLFGVNPSHPAERLSLSALRCLPRLRERARNLLQTNARHWNEFIVGRTDLEGDPVHSGTVTFPKLLKGDVDVLCRHLRDTYETTVVPGSFFDLPDSFRVGLGVREKEFQTGLRNLGMALDAVAGSRSS